MESLLTNWHVLYVRPKSEVKTARRLNDLEINAHAPTQRQLRSWSDRRKWMDVVLFPAYVFAEITPTRKNDVFTIEHVVKYVQIGREIAKLTPADVKLIQSLSQIETPVTVTPQFQKGAEIEVMRGPLTGFRGYVAETSRNLRISIEIRSLGCFAIVEINSLDVRKI